MKIAFIIPIHPKHYDYIYNFIDTIKIYIDIYLVFSNENDYIIFNKKDKIKKIIIPNINTNNIVTYKKFYALDKLKNDINYQYFINECAVRNGHKQPMFLYYFEYNIKKYHYF